MEVIVRVVRFEVIVRVVRSGGDCESSEGWR